MLRFIKTHALTIGLILMFALTWPVDLSLAAYSRGLINFRIPEPLAIFVGYGIVIATILITAVVSGRAGVAELLRRFLIWRVGWRWYAAALFIPPALMLLTIGLNSLFSQTLPDFNQYAGREIFGSDLSPLLLFLPFLVFDFLANGEEIGWRGFALPRLQKRRSALVASLILGAVWAFWHLPKFLMGSSTLGGGRDLSDFSIQSIELLAKAILFTWVFNNTKGSLLLVTLFHASWNAAWIFLPMQNVGLAGVIVYWLAAVLVVFSTDPTRLVRRPKALPVKVRKPGLSS